MRKFIFLMLEKGWGVEGFSPGATRDPYITLTHLGVAPETLQESQLRRLSKPRESKMFWWLEETLGNIRGQVEQLSFIAPLLTNEFSKLPWKSCCVRCTQCWKRGPVHFELTFVMWAEFQGLFIDVLTCRWYDGAVAHPLRQISAVLVDIQNLALILNIKLHKGFLLQLLGHILRRMRLLIQCEQSTLAVHWTILWCCLSSLFYCISWLSVCNYIPQ